MREFIIRSAILVLLAASAVLARAIDQHDPLSMTVKHFRAEKVPLLDALLSFAQEQHLPLGIEYIDLHAVSDQVSIDIGSATVSQVLDAILKRAPGYTWSIRDDVICISHSDVPVGGSNLLDRVLSDFSIPRMSVTRAALALDRALYMDLHQGTQGWAGSYAGKFRDGRWTRYEMHGVTVRDVLNRIVRDAGDAAWVIQVPPKNLDNLPFYGLWRTIQYEVPPKQYGSLFRGFLLDIRTRIKPEWRSSEGSSSATQFRR